MASLTGKQQAFVDAYITCGFNATEAARRAGYSGDDTAMRVVGARNIANVNVRAEIDRLLSERLMSRDEVLARLAEHAGVTLDDFVDEAGDIDLERARTRGKMHLAKKYTRTETVSKFGMREVRAQIELHDPQSALVQLGRYYKLFTDKIEYALPPELVALLKELGIRPSDTFEAITQEAKALLAARETVDKP